MRVIGAGFGRTGTNSLKLALDRLGFGPCDHMFEIAGDAERIHRWLAIAEGRSTDWDGLFAGFRSAVDWPAAAYWRELAAHYPEAKVLLTVRDPDSWYESTQATVFKRNRLLGLLTWSAGLRNPNLRAFVELDRLTVQKGVFGGDTRTRDHMIRIYHDHIAQVKAEIPADRLLVYDVAEGWEPLCGFLGVPVPDDPFPRVNRRGDFSREAGEHVAQLLAPGGGPPRRGRRRSSGSTS
jgi:hypothetical protein